MKRFIKCAVFCIRYRGEQPKLNSLWRLLVLI